MVRFIIIIGIVMTLTGCARDYDINPYTTVFRLINSQAGK